MTCCARWTQIQDDAFNVKILFGLQLAKGLLERMRGAGLRRGGQLRAAAPIRAQIQNSKFKISANRVYFGIYSDSGCSLRRSRMFGNELRASAAPRLRPADPSGIDSIEVVAFGSPQCAVKANAFAGKFGQPGPAARSRPGRRAATRVPQVRSSGPIRSAAGLPYSDASRLPGSCSLHRTARPTAKTRRLQKVSQAAKNKVYIPDVPLLDSNFVLATFASAATPKKEARCLAFPMIVSYICGTFIESRKCNFILVRRT